MTTQPRDTSYTAAAAGARRVEQLPFPISRHTDPVSVRPGTRVIVRYALDHATDGASQGFTVSDVLGELVSVEPLRIRRQGWQPEQQPRQDAGPTEGELGGELHGELHRGLHGEHPAAAMGASRPADGIVTIDPARVVVLKTLSAKPVRNSDIRAVEQAIAEAFPGIANAHIGGWLARAGDGITERSNSAVPLEPSAGSQPVPLQEIHEFYRAHQLPTQLLIPDRIARSAEHLAGIRGPEIIIMTRELDRSAPPLVDTAAAPGALSSAVTVRTHPSERWLQMYHFRGKPLPRHALDLLSAQIDGILGFAELIIGDELAAITRATITSGGHHRWLGFAAVEVAPAFRRQGLGTLLGTKVLQWGADHGADRAYLEVIETNIAGRALYHQLGFSEHHRHRSIRLAP